MSSPVDMIVNHPLFRIAAPIYLRRGWKSQVIEEDAARLRSRSWTDKKEYERFWKPLMRAVWAGSIEEIAERIAEHRGDLEPREASVLLRRAMSSVVRRSFKKGIADNKTETVRQDAILSARDFPMLPSHGFYCSKQIEWVCSISTRLAQWLRFQLDLATVAPKWCLSADLQSLADRCRAETIENIADFSDPIASLSGASTAFYRGPLDSEEEAIPSIGQMLVGDSLTLESEMRRRFSLSLDFLHSSAGIHVFSAASCDSPGGLFNRETNSAAPFVFYAGDAAYSSLLWRMLGDRTKRFYFCKLASEAEGLTQNETHRLVQEAMVGSWPDSATSYGDALIETICDAIESYPLETQVYIEATRSAAETRMRNYKPTMLSRLTVPGLQQIPLYGRAARAVARRPA
jgi:hypothetical protein